MGEKGDVFHRATKREPKENQKRGKYVFWVVNGVSKQGSRVTQSTYYPWMYP